MRRIRHINQKALGAMGYRQFNHGGFLWWATEDGAVFVLSEKSWARRGLNPQSDRRFLDKETHRLCVAQAPGGREVLLKTYHGVENSSGVGQEVLSRARNEFFNTLAVYKKRLMTVLPVAFGTAENGSGMEVIIYPFLHEATSFAKLCLGIGNGSRPWSIREKQILEKRVGGLVQEFLNRGVFPRGITLLDHLLAYRKGGNIQLYWIDLERVDFPVMSWARRKKRNKYLVQLLCQLEWCRLSGGNVNRASIMRIATSYFGGRSLTKRNKFLYRKLITEARGVVSRRRLGRTMPYPVTEWEV